jgi:hypothetical protein
VKTFFSFLISLSGRVHIYNRENKDKLIYCFFLPFILKSIGTDIDANSDPIIRFAFSIAVLAIICLISFINLIGYFSSLYIINKYDIQSKYPKIYNYLKHYEKVTLFFIVFEILTCLLFLIFIIVLNLILAGIIIIK